MKIKPGKCGSLCCNGLPLVLDAGLPTVLRGIQDQLDAYKASFGR